EDGIVNCWDGERGEFLAGMAWEIGRLGGVAFSPDGFTCIAGGEGGRLVVWDLDADAGSTPRAAQGQQREEEPKDDPDEAPDDQGPGGPSWVAVDGFDFPDDAVVAGHEADGTPLYAARAAHRGALLPGKVRHGFAGANVGYRKREVAVMPFEVLVGSA